MAFLFQRKNKYWYIGYYISEYRDGIKKLKRQNVSTGQKSKMKAGEVLQKFNEDKKQLDKPKIILCSDFINEYLKISCFTKCKKHQGNIKEKFDYLIDKLGDKYIHQYDIQDIDKILHLKTLENRSMFTIRNYRSIYITAFEQARKWKYIKINPAIDSTLIKLPEPEITTYTLEDLKKLLDNSNEIYKDIFIFSLYTGLRIGDIVNIKLSDIDFQNKIISVGNDVHISKNKKQNYIEIADAIIEILQKYRMQNLEYLFESKFRKKYSPHTISNKIKKIINEAGINKKLNHKAFRKTFATFLYQEGICIEDISRMLHHSSVRVTKKHYAKMLRSPFTGKVNCIQEHLQKVI